MPYSNWPYVFEINPSGMSNISSPARAENLVGLVVSSRTNHVVGVAIAAAVVVEDEVEIETETEHKREKDKDKKKT